MEFEIVTMASDGDLQTLAVVDWPALPRAGDVLFICGLVQRCEDANDKTKTMARERTHPFKVDHVMWSTDVSRKTIDVDIQVYVVPEDAVWDNTSFDEGVPT